MSGKACKEYCAIVAMLSRYFEGLYHSDVSMLSGVFHPEARYCCAVGGTFISMSMQDYFDLLQGRRSPASQSQMRRDRIMSIEVVGAETALAKVNCAIGERFFTDFLSLVFHDNQWWIISKVFHYDIIFD